MSIGLYGAATVAHGSGFLAVFIAGIVIGDVRAPFKGEVERFHSSLASLAEMIAFVVLGLTVSLGAVGQQRAWLIGLVLAVLLAPAAGRRVAAGGAPRPAGAGARRYRAALRG